MTWKEYSGPSIPKIILPDDVDRELLFLVLSGKCPHCKTGKLVESIDKEYPPKKVICGNCLAKGQGMKIREAFVDLILNGDKQNEY